MDYTRRDFLQSITKATLAAAGISLLPADEVQATAFPGQGEKDYSAISRGATVVFQGDSITDAGRQREESGANLGLGSGYAFLAAAHLRHVLASREVHVYNRGISGNKVFQLGDRWQEDCLQLEPNILSILVGVNDYWHTLDYDYDGTVKTYKKDYEALLKRTRDALGEVQLVIGEPFVIKEGTAITDEWFPAFQEYQAVAREVAQAFDAAFIPYQSIFEEASQAVNDNVREETGKDLDTSPAYWAADGVHPTLAGAQLMAQGWLETVKRL